MCVRDRAYAPRWRSSGGCGGGGEDLVELRSSRSVRVELLCYLDDLIFTDATPREGGGPAYGVSTFESCAGLLLKRNWIPVLSEAGGGKGDVRDQLAQHGGHAKDTPVPGWPCQPARSSQQAQAMF